MHAIRALIYRFFPLFSLSVAGRSARRVSKVLKATWAFTAHRRKSYDTQLHVSTWESIIIKKFAIWSFTMKLNFEALNLKSLLEPTPGSYTKLWASCIQLIIRAQAFSDSREWGIAGKLSMFEWRRKAAELAMPCRVYVLSRFSFWKGKALFRDNEWNLGWVNALRMKPKSLLGSWKLQIPALFTRRLNILIARGLFCVNQSSP